MPKAIKQLNIVECRSCTQAVRENDILICRSCERDCCPECADPANSFTHRECAANFEDEVSIFQTENSPA